MIIILREVEIDVNGRLVVFRFSIRDHLRDRNAEQGLEKILKNIANWIADNTTNTGAWIDGPLWAREIDSRNPSFYTGYRAAYINSLHPLFSELDNRSRQYDNYLIWSGRADEDDIINVTHFGPFGRAKDDKMTDDLDSARLTLVYILDQIGIANNNGHVTQKPESGSDKERDFMDAVSREMLKYVKNMNKAYKQLKAVSARIFPTDEKRSRKFYNTIIKIGVKGLIMIEKIILIQLLVIGGKAVAKSAGKTAAKSAGKSFVKKLPLIGLGFGLIIGGVRLFSGDPGRAALEVTSGAVSCVPVLGTIASLGIDAAIAGIDINEATMDQQNQARELSMEIKNANKDIEKYEEKLSGLAFVIGLAQFSPDSGLFNREGIDYINSNVQELPS